MLRRFCYCIAASVALLGTASADILFVTSGLSPNNVPVEFRSTFSVSGNTLSVLVENTSSSPILNPTEVLGSMYFDIVDANGNRPTLQNFTATGDVYNTLRNSADVLQTTGANLVASVNSPGTWQFKTFNPALSPFTGFGVSTVGNSGINPNNFNGNIVGGIDYAIFTGEITTQNLHNRLLVKDKILMTFSGVQGFSEKNVRNVVFGLGTGPDALLTAHAVPEPGMLAIVAIGSGILLSTCRRRRA